MKNRTIQNIVILLVVLVLSTAAGCYRKTPEQRAERIVNGITEKLDLDEAQKSKLNSMKEEFLAKAPAMKKAREETFDEMIGLMRGPSIDQGRIDELIRKNRAQADDLIGYLFNNFAEFHAMLTPEQREKAAREMERWREHYQEYKREGKP